MARTHTLLKEVEDNTTGQAETFSLHRDTAGTLYIVEGGAEEAQDWTVTLEGRVDVDAPWALVVQKVKADLPVGYLTSVTAITALPEMRAVVSNWTIAPETTPHITVKVVL